MEEIKKEIVEVSKAEWDALNKSIEMLKYAADKGRVARWDANHLGNKEKSVSLHVEDGKVIVSWRMMRDERILDPKTNAQTGEIQEVEVVFQDGTKKVILGYGNFANMLYANEIQARVIGELKNADGNLDFKVVLPSGEEMIIGDRYVN